MIDGAHLAARMIAREQVDTVFTLCGGHIMPLYNGLRDENIRVVDMRHEQAAAHAADAYARLTRRAGIAIVTAGVGVTDAVTGIANAAQADSPMLVIGGQAPSDQFEMGSLQELDSISLVSSITKWARSVAHTRRIPEFLAIAFRHMFAGRWGPAFLEIPIDVLIGAVDDSETFFPENYRVIAPPRGDPNALQRALDLLRAAERPVVIAGSQIWWSDAADTLARFAERAHIPIYLNAMARGALAPAHPNHFALSRKFALARADVIAVIGAPLDFRLGYGQPPTFNADAKIIHVDIDARELGRNRGATVGIVGDVRAVLEELTDAASSSRADIWIKELREREASEAEKLFVHANSDAIPIHPLRMAKEIRAVLDDDTIVIGDGGNIVAQAAKLIAVAKPGHWLDPGRFGCLGVGIPFAIAAKLVHPKSNVIVINGDGAFGLNGFEMDTAVRFNLPLVSVIGNDAAWGQIRGPQIQFYGADRAIASALALSRYDKVVDALGGYGEFVEEPKQLRGALERALASGKPACVNVRIDADANAAVSANSMVV
ncbi:MAG: acetolactate synthase [Chloroflexi bacterium]|nr:acetolactate synthase [Chloroflexota bacterium]